MAYQRQRYTYRVKPLRHILAQATVLAMLAPLLSLALSCQITSASNMDAMACCRKMHSSCMQGEQAGSMACCHRVQPQAPAVLTAAATEATATASSLLAHAAALPAQASMPHRADAALAPPAPPPLFPITLRC